jgi:hypothetical protein
MAASTKYPPLTKGQLRAIYEDAPTRPVKRLLCEIHRLRAVVLLAHDFVRSIDRHRHSNTLTTASYDALNKLRHALDREPVVREEGNRPFDYATVQDGKALLPELERVEERLSEGE